MDRTNGLEQTGSTALSVNVRSSRFATRASGLIEVR